MDRNEKLWPPPPSNEQLGAARARIHRGCIKPCPEQTFDSCPTPSRPSMSNALPVAHAPSLPGATRFFVLGFTNFKWGFVAARHNDGAKSTSSPLPLFSHDWCTSHRPPTYLHGTSLSWWLSRWVGSWPTSQSDDAPAHEALLSLESHACEFATLRTPNVCTPFILCPPDYLVFC